MESVVLGPVYSSGTALKFGQIFTRAREFSLLVGFSAVLSRGAPSQSGETSERRVGYSSYNVRRKFPGKSRSVGIRIGSRMGRNSICTGRLHHGKRRGFQVADGARPQWHASADPSMAVV